MSFTADKNPKRCVLPVLRELADIPAAEWAHFEGQLRWLDLGLNRIGAAGLEALAASPNLPQLEWLGFRVNAVGDPTPQHADEYDADSAVARELQARYGPRPWLSAHRRPEWPPGRDCYAAAWEHR